MTGQNRRLAGDAGRDSPSAVIWIHGAEEYALSRYLNNGQGPIGESSAIALARQLRLIPYADIALTHAPAALRPQMNIHIARLPLDHLLVVDVLGADCALKPVFH